VTFEEWMVRWHGRILTEAAIRELRLVVENLSKEDEEDE
jgi:hypothetical protein